MQKHSILDVWGGSAYACGQIAPDNVLCHHTIIQFLNSYMARG